MSELLRICRAVVDESHGGRPRGLSRVAASRFVKAIERAEAGDAQDFEEMAPRCLRELGTYWEARRFEDRIADLENDLRAHRLALSHSPGEIRKTLDGLSADAARNGAQALDGLDRARPLAKNTRQRIRRGLEKLATEPYEIRLGRGAPKPLTLPIVDLAADRPASAVLPVAGNTFERTPGNRARDAETRPLDVVHGTLDRAVVVPPMGKVAARDAHMAPAPTQPTTTRPALVVHPGGTWSEGGPVDEPLATQTSRESKALVMANRAKPRSSSAFGNEAIIAGPVRGGADFQHWCEAWAAEALRVLRPGGHLLAFGGSRTHHRLVVGIEDAGFEIRDRIDGYNGQSIECSDGSLAWYFGSGFPKSLDVSKAIDKAAGAEREVVGEEPDRWTQKGGVLNFATDRPQESVPVTGAPVTEDAQRWDGWGTALKPAHEPIVVARKPLVSTVAANVLEHGTGAINVAACRIDGPAPHSAPARANAIFGSQEASDDSVDRERYEMPSGGRWPANVVLDPGAAAMLDEQTGELKSGFMAAGTEREGLGYRGGLGNRVRHDTHGDSGGASRFFYCAKTSRAERNAGLEGFEERMSQKWNEGGIKARREAEGKGMARNHHPTVKPINLMRWLVRLVTPPGGTVLDPFTGSGSTGCAAVLEGFDFIGCEREEEYVEIATARIVELEAHVAA